MDEEFLNEEEVKQFVDAEMARRFQKPNRATRRKFKKQHHQEIDVVYENARKLLYKEMIEKLREKNKEYETAENGNPDVQS